MKLLKQIDARLAKYSFIYSFVMSLIMTIGRSIDINMDVFKSSVLLFIFCFIGFFAVFYFFLDKLPKLIEMLNKIKINIQIENLFLKPNIKCFRNCVFLMLLFYIPVIIAFFPAIAAYDVFWHVAFFTHHDTVEIHPILYNFIVYMLFMVGLKIKSTSIMFYLYVVIQTVIMLSIFSYCIFILSKYKVNSVFKIAALLFFALNPIHHIFCVNVLKDTLFSGFCLLFILSMFELVNSKEPKKINIVAVVISAILMFLFRHNAFFAYVLILPFLYLCFKKRKKVFLMLLIPVLFNFLFIGIKRLNHIQPPSIASYLAIPLQQMAYVRLKEDRNLLIDFSQNSNQNTDNAKSIDVAISEYIKAADDKNLTKEDKDTFRALVSKYNEFNYQPFNVDPVKFDYYNYEPDFNANYNKNLMLHSDHIQNALKSDPWRFIKLYLKWAGEYPKDYINAAFFHTYYYWYPLAKWSESNICLGQIVAVVSNWHKSMLLTNYNLLPSVKKIYQTIFNSSVCEKHLLLFIMLSMGINTCFNIFMFFVLFYRKKYNFILPLLIIPALFLTVLAGPQSVLRYIYQNYIIIPLLISFCFSDFTSDDNNV